MTEGDVPAWSGQLECDVAIAASDWTGAIGFDDDALADFSDMWVRRSLDAAGLDPSRPLMISVLWTDDDRMQQLNSAWRGKDRPTNILSFPALPDFPDLSLSDLSSLGREDATPAVRCPERGISGAPPAMLGDLALGLGVITAEAAAQGKTVADHAAHLLVHGVAHLLGMDHVDEAEAEMMEAFETRVLARYGISDPYAWRGAAGETSFSDEQGQ